MEVEDFAIEPPYAKKEAGTEEQRINSAPWSWVLASARLSKCYVDISTRFIKNEQNRIDIKLYFNENEHPCQYA